MQRIYSEMNLTEECEVHRECYGELSFDDWLAKRGLHKPVITVTGGGAELDLSSKANRKKSLPNERRTESAPGKIIHENAQPPKSGNFCFVHYDTKELIDTTKQVQKSESPVMVKVEKPRLSPAPTTRVYRMVGDDMASHEKEQKKRLKEKERIIVAELRHDSVGVDVKRLTPADGQSNVQPYREFWNSSTRPPASWYRYVRRLPDHYPRDEYSLLPNAPTAKRRTTQSPTRMLAEEDLRRKREMDEAAPKMTFSALKECTASAVVMEKPKTPVVWKPKTILDVNRRRHYSPDSVPKSEAALHITDDMTSWLFQTSLLSSCYMGREGAPRSAATSDSDVTVDCVYEL